MVTNRKTAAAASKQPRSYTTSLTGLRPTSPLSLARAGALFTAVALVVTALAFVIGRLWSGNIKIPMARALVATVVGATWLGRFAFARSAYQWTVEDGELTLQDAALFGPSRLKTVAAAQVKGFEADPRELRIQRHTD